MTSEIPTGMHLIVDIESGCDLTNVDQIRGCLEACAVACNARILHGSFHSFGEAAGVTGVLILMESHISIHTWPEKNYAAIDIFMCSQSDPRDALPVLEGYFRPIKVETTCIQRRLP